MPKIATVCMWMFTNGKWRDPFSENSYVDQRTGLALTCVIQSPNTIPHVPKP